MKRSSVQLPGPEGRFEKQWKWIPEKRRLENRLFGSAVQVIDVVNEETGDVAYEGMVLEYRRVELHVPIRRDDLAIGFVFHRRVSMIPPEVSAREFAKEPRQILSVIEYGIGIDEYELPHGLAINRFEEVFQEIGCRVMQAESIGFVKDTPAIGGVAHELFAIEVSREASGEKLEEYEQVKHVRFFPAREVRGIETICGLTQAALWRFRSWGLTQKKNTLWYATATEL